jgi:hypothetical protein
MSRREEIEAALTSWREADRRLEASTDGDRDAIQAEVERHRSEFQRLSADHMVDRIDALKDAEERRREATPSTPPFHEAARDELEIAAEIWEGARQSDRDTPQHGT